MANAKRCDKCYKFYCGNSRPTSGRILGGIVGGIATLDVSGSWDMAYDLCDECLEKLEVFLSHPDENDPK